METVLRVLVTYFFILFALRVMGKREFGQMSPLEMVTLLLIPDIVSQSIVGEDYSITNSFTALATLFSIVFITSNVVHLSKTAEKLVNESPAVLVQNGKLIADTMNKERVTPDELISEAHKVGITTVDEIAWAILHGDGKIAIIPKERPEYQRSTDDRKTAL